MKGADTAPVPQSEPIHDEDRGTSIETSAFDFADLFQSYRSCVFAKDVDALMDLYDRDLVAFDTWLPWSFAGAGTWRDMNREWLGSLGSESVVVRFENVGTAIGPDLAIAHATVSYAALSASGETLRAMKNRLTWVVKRKDAVWKIVHQHTSVPIEPDGLKAVLGPPKA